MDKGKIYLAARYPRRDEMKALATQLRMAGFVTTSRWLHETSALDHTLNDASPAYFREQAAIDLEDVDRADTMIFFAEDPLVGTPRGGRHVEFGYALAKGKQMVVIGDAENIFHFMPNVMTFPTIQAFLEYSEVYA
jgi:nucleoside 2-deoxyribosyltransferase